MGIVRHIFARLLASGPLLLALAASAAAQTPAGSATCAPTDSAAAAAWRRTYHSPNRSWADSARYGAAPSGTVEFGPPFADSSFRHPAAFVGRYRLTLVQLRPGGEPDAVTRGFLELHVPSGTEREALRAAGRSAAVDLIGRLAPWPEGSATGSAGADTVWVEATVDPTRGFAFAPAPGLLVDDGPGFAVTEVSDRGLRGEWWPAGAIWPPPFGYFCAERSEAQ